eukprot:gene32704-40360_t
MWTLRYFLNSRCRWVSCRFARGLALQPHLAKMGGGIPDRWLRDPE